MLSSRESDRDVVPLVRRASAGARPFAEGVETDPSRAAHTGAVVDGFTSTVACAVTSSPSYGFGAGDALTPTEPADSLGSRTRTSLPTQEADAMRNREETQERTGRLR